MTDRQLRDQLMTLLVAGHDTTATGLSWALERLTRHPGVLEKAVQAADAGAAGDSAGDEYLDAVAKDGKRIEKIERRDDTRRDPVRSNDGRRDDLRRDVDRISKEIYRRR